MAEQHVVIRAAKSEDCEEILRLIIELAEFLKMADQVKMTAEILRRDLFEDHPKCYSTVAAVANSERPQLVGITLYYPIYSTWEGVCLYVEDIYVTPAHRGTGLGKRLWQYVTKIGLDWNCARLQGSVLNWNTFAKDFYTRHGMVDLTEKEDWHFMRMCRNEMEDFVKDLKD